MKTVPRCPPTLCSGDPHLRHLFCATAAQNIPSGMTEDMFVKDLQESWPAMLRDSPEVFLHAYKHFVGQSDNEFLSLMHVNPNTGHKAPIPLVIGIQRAG